MMVCSLLLAMIGTGGFSEGSADRQATVSVAEDPSAYVGIDPGECDLTNRFVASVTVTLTTENGSQTLELEPGETGDVTVGGSTDVTVESDDGMFEVTMERTFDCSK